MSPLNRHSERSEESLFDCGDRNKTQERFLAPLGMTVVLAFPQPDKATRDVALTLWALAEFRASVCLGHE